MLLALVLSTAFAATEPCDFSLVWPYRYWCYFDMQAGVGIVGGATSRSAGFTALVASAKWDFFAPAHDVGVGIDLGPSWRGEFGEDGYFGMYIAETIHWHHDTWGIGVGVELPNGMISLIQDSSPEFGGCPMVEGWWSPTRRVTLMGRMGTAGFHDLYGSFGASWNFFVVNDDSVVF